MCTEMSVASFFSKRRHCTDIGPYKSQLSLSTALPCSANSTYSACMTSCPASCSNLAAPSECDTTNCIEGCQCAAGFVMSEETCVPYRECGCTFLDRYYPVRRFLKCTLCVFQCVCECVCLFHWQSEDIYR